MFIHIRPDETRALARIPPELLFPAPGLARGHVLMGYNERGECPMLQNNRCSIYEDRPQTCRDYDCRVFAAAALEPDGRTQPVIAERVRAWRFEIKSDEVQADQEAIAATAAFLREMPAQFPNESLPTQPSQLALLAIRLFRLFRKLPRERAAGGLLREIQRRRRRD
jgi:Fe-S-cluster containining protein